MKKIMREKDAFLHYLDLGVRYRQYEHFISLYAGSDKKVLPLHKLPKQPATEKDGKIQNTVKNGDEVLVQIVKEPISTKGPRLTCEITFAGRFLVMIPFSEKVNVSTKIKSDSERARIESDEDACIASANDDIENLKMMIERANQKIADCTKKIQKVNATVTSEIATIESLKKFADQLLPKGWEDNDCRGGRTRAARTLL